MSISHPLRADLVSTMPVERIFQKHIVDGRSFLFNQLLGKCDWEYELRDELARALGANINDVVIVGSSKLGFSIKTQNFREFDHDFRLSKNPRKRSDVDIAIINNGCFDRIAKQIFSLSRHFEKEWQEANWKVNDFYHEERNLATQYTLYLAKGWLRPDYLPTVYYSTAPWKTVVETWRRRLGGRKISIGFYSEWFYLKHYQMGNLERLRTLINALEI